MFIPTFWEKTSFTASFARFGRLLTNRLTQQLLLALEHVTKCDIIHQDVKPENLMLYNLRFLEQSFSARWWQLKYFLFSSLLGEDSHFDEKYFSNGLKPPPRKCN